jgi:hypothetical protein
MPKGVIHSASSRANSKYDIALKTGKGLPQARQKVASAQARKVPTSSVVKRVIYKDGKASPVQGGYQKEGLSNPKKVR